MHDLYQFYSLMSKFLSVCPSFLIIKYLGKMFINALLLLNKNNKRFDMYKIYFITMSAHVSLLIGQTRCILSARAENAQSL